jgi:hypothetical protein
MNLLRNCRNTAQHKNMNDLIVIKSMAENGGGFVKALSKAASLADKENLGRIRNAWPEYWAKYEQIKKNKICLETQTALGFYGDMENKNETAVERVERLGWDLEMDAGIEEWMTTAEKESAATEFLAKNE